MIGKCVIVLRIFWNIPTDQISDEQHEAENHSSRSFRNLLQGNEIPHHWSAHGPNYPQLYRGIFPVFWTSIIYPSLPFKLLNRFMSNQELKKHGVKDVVRVCEPTYKVEEMRKEGIEVTDLCFDDGTFPPSEVVEQWFDLLRRRFRSNSSSSFQFI